MPNRSPRPIASALAKRLPLAAMATALTILGSSPSVGEPVCKPALSLKSGNFSEAVNLRRIWRARIEIDASHCATTRGLFAVSFVRGVENGPDLEFNKPFLWHVGQTEIRVEFWHDESVVRSRLDDVATCPCRAD